MPRRRQRRVKLRRRRRRWCLRVSPRNRTHGARRGAAFNPGSRVINNEHSTEIETRRFFK